jgi:hypothetical protein
MAKKFTLTPSPTFRANVSIQIPGERPAQIEFIFKHRNREEFRKFSEGLEGRGDVEILLDIASGWDLDDAFDEKNLQQLVDNYMGAGRAVLETYVTELTASRAKN